MKSNQTNAIANVTATLVGNKAVAQNRKASKPVITLGKELALKGISSYLKGATAKDGAIVTMNEGLKPFIDAKVKLVKLSEKSKKGTPEFQFTEFTRTAFIDGMVKMVSPITGKAYPKATAEQYYKTFFNAVNSGKPIEYADANKNKKGSSPKGEGVTPDQAIKQMNSALFKVWQLSDVSPKALAEIDKLLDTKGDILSAITAYLESQDYNLGE